VTLVSLLLLRNHNELVVDAFSTGAGGCDGGTAAVGGLHLDTSNGRPVESGTLTDGAIRVTIGTQVLSETAVTDVPIGQDLLISVDALDLAYLGILVRLEAPVGVNTAGALLPGPNTQGTDVCAAPIVGITHTDSTEKEMITGTIRFDEEVLNVALDVSIVFVNSGAVSGYVYGRLNVNFRNTPVASPVASPVVSPVVPISLPVAPSPIIPPIDPPITAPAAIPTPVGVPATEPPSTEPTASNEPSLVPSNTSDNPVISPVAPISLPVASPIVPPVVPPITIPAAIPTPVGVPSNTPTNVPSNSPDQTTENPVISPVAPISLPIAPSPAFPPVGPPMMAPAAIPTPVRVPVTALPFNTPNPTPEQFGKGKMAGGMMMKHSSKGKGKSKCGMMMMMMMMRGKGSGMMMMMDGSRHLGR
jgi:hypothetical protein